MRRRLLNLLTFVSLLLCVAVVALWVRGVGYWWNGITGYASQVRGPHLGFWLRLGLDNGPGYVWSLPYWKALLLASALPILRVLRLGYERRRRHRGLCPACGYDLRATPDRCPECGATR